MHNFRELIVWKKNRALVKEVYSVTSNFPNSEIYGLTNQMRRASVSIPSNIAEGSGHKSSKEFCRYLEIANSSSLELETQFYLSFDLEYITEKELDHFIERIHEIQKMIFSLEKNLDKGNV